jgi:hypothetical protein
LFVSHGYAYRSVNWHSGSLINGYGLTNSIALHAEASDQVVNGSSVVSVLTLVDNDHPLFDRSRAVETLITPIKDMSWL